MNWAKWVKGTKTWKNMNSTNQRKVLNGGLVWIGLNGRNVNVEKNGMCILKGGKG
jgi:hypothetical protein